MIISRFLRDDRGQATTEYILLLVIAISLATYVIRNLLRPALDGVLARVTGNIQSAFFGGDLHRLRLGR